MTNIRVRNKHLSGGSKTMLLKAAISTNLGPHDDVARDPYDSSICGHDRYNLQYIQTFRSEEASWPLSLTRVVPVPNISPINGHNHLTSPTSWWHTSELISSLFELQGRILRGRWPREFDFNIAICLCIDVWLLKSTGCGRTYILGVWKQSAPNLVLCRVQNILIMIWGKDLVRRYFINSFT